MANVNVVNDLEFAFKFLQLYKQVTLSPDMTWRLLEFSHEYPWDKRSEWLLREAGLVCEEGTTFRVVYPDRFTYAMLKYS